MGTVEKIRDKQCKTYKNKIKQFTLIKIYYIFNILKYIIYNLKK